MLAYILTIYKCRFESKCNIFLISNDSKITFLFAFIKGLKYKKLNNENILKLWNCRHMLNIDTNTFFFAERLDDLYDKRCYNIPIFSTGCDKIHWFIVS